MMTSRQARLALSALDRLQNQRTVKAKTWEEEALARLRWHLMAFMDERDSRTYLDGIIKWEAGRRP